MLLRHERGRSQGRRGYTDAEFGDGVAYRGETPAAIASSRGHGGEIGEEGR